jgi:hypothetical protein
MPKRSPTAKEKRAREAAAQAPEPSTPAPPPKRIMATFYLSPEAVDKLDRVWLARRMKDRKAQKSQIIEELVMRALKEERLP